MFKMNAPNVIKRDTITNSTNSHARAHKFVHEHAIHLHLLRNQHWYCHRCDNISGIFIIYLVNNIGINMNNNIGSTFIFTL